MSEAVNLGGHPRGVFATLRTDNWRALPLATVAGLTLFIVYSTWAAFQGEHYFHEPYLSPFYSPVLFTKLDAPGAAPLHHAWLGEWPSAVWPSFVPASPALLILIFPGLFRFTCYYYRKAYYRSFAGTPPACAVTPLPRKDYRGETMLLVFQNLHRYALYIALVYIVILYYDAFVSFWRHGQFGVGVGTIVLLINATLLACYTCGCHSLRHLIGGGLDRFACNSTCAARHAAWKKVSWLNQYHQEFAWCSLFWVGFSDLYVRLVSMGIWTDFNTWGN